MHRHCQDTGHVGDQEKPTPHTEDRRSHGYCRTRNDWRPNWHAVSSSVEREFHVTKRHGQFAHCPAVKLRRQRSRFFVAPIVSVEPPEQLCRDGKSQATEKWTESLHFSEVIAGNRASGVGTDNTASARQPGRQRSPGATRSLRSGCRAGTLLIARLSRSRKPEAWIRRRAPPRSKCRRCGSS